VKPAPLEDITAIHAAKTPDELWRYVVATVHLRALPNTFEAASAFRSLHKDRSDGALRTAQLLCTDLRWRKVAAPLIVDIERTGILDEGELDELADGFLWHDRLMWPVPQQWVGDGFVRLPRNRRPPGAGDLVVERQVPPPLRRWAAARVAARRPDRIADALERVMEVDARSGDAIMTGLLDGADRLPREAREVLLDLAYAWPCGSVRLRALKLLAEADPSTAAERGREDASETVRIWASRLMAPPARPRRPGPDVDPSPPKASPPPHPTLFD
jgi:hypothetical protein